MPFITTKSGDKTAVSSRDYATICQYTWYKSSQGYFVCRRPSIRLHRLVAARMNLNIVGRMVDHKDRNKSNNTRSNLRLATNSQNIANSVLSSANKYGVKGVSFSNNRWVAAITCNGIRHYLGCFESITGAGKAYAQASQRLFRQFANPIFNYKKHPTIKRLNTNNTSGVKGVCRHKNKWYVQRRINGHKQSLGYFNTLEEAKQAYMNAHP